MKKNTSKDPLANIPVKTKAESKSKVPTMIASRDETGELDVAVQQYINANVAMKEAQEQMDGAAALIRQVGLSYVVERNCTNPSTQIKSVNIVRAVSSTDLGIQVSLAARSKDVNPDMAKDLFSKLSTCTGKKPKVEDYLEWQVQAVFNSQVFKTADGQWQWERYEAIMAALNAACAKLQVDNPLELSKTLVPKPDFHEARYRDFDVDANMSLMAVVPPTVSLKVVPVPTEA